MCWKFLVSITVLVVASILLASITDASFNYDSDKSFCMPNKQRASRVAAKAATVAEPAMGAQTDVGDTAGQQDKIELSDQAQQAAQAATEVLAGKKNQLEMLVQRLVENQNAIDEGERAVAVTTCALKRVLWLRESTRLGLENMMRMYKESHGTDADINYLAAFAQKEEAEKTKLLGTAFRRLDNLKGSLKEAQAELKNIRQSAKKANRAAEEARQRIYMLRRLVPKIKMLKRQDLKTVKDFLYKRRHATHHST